MRFMEGTFVCSGIARILGPFSPAGKCAGEIAQLGLSKLNPGRAKL
jgi:hypothetical protein